MKPLASKRVLRLAVLAAVAAAMLAATGCGARRAEQHRKTGDTYLQLSDYEKAAQEYARAIELDPKNAEARYGQAAVLLRQKKTADALAGFRQVIEMQPAFAPAYYEAVRILLPEQKTDEAEAVAKKMQEAVPEKGDLLLADIYLETGRANQAVEFLSGKAAGESTTPALRIALAKAYLAAGQPDKGEAELKALIDQGGDMALPARMALVDLYRASGRLDASIAELRTLVEERPEDRNLKLVLARSLLEDGQYDEARTMTEPVLAEAPDSPWANYIIGSCYVAQGAYEEAVPYLETAANALPQQPAIERQLALARSGGKSAPPAATEPSAVAETTPSPGAAPTAPAAPAASVPETATFSELWRSGQVTALVEQRQRLLDEPGSDVERRETIALAAVIAGRSNEAMEVAQGLPEDSPLGAFVKALDAKDQNAALKALEPWKEVQTGSQAVLYRNALGHLLARAGLRGQSLVALSGTAQAGPDNVVYLINLARMFRSAQMPEFAAGALQKLLTRYPDNLEARQLLFQVYVEDDKLEQAKDVAENLYGLFPDRKEAVLSLAQVYTMTGQTELAAEVLTRTLEADQADPAYALGLGTVKMVEGKVADAVALAEQVKTDSPWSERTRREILALGKASQGDWAGVTAALDGSVDNLSGSLRGLFAAAKVAQGGAADATLVVPEGRPAPMEPKIQVLLLALGKTIENARPAQRELASALAAQPAALATYAAGLAALDSNLGRTALEAFEKAAQQVGENPYLVYARFGALTKMRNAPERVNQGRALAESHADMPEAWAGLAMVLQDAQDASGAREALDKAVALGPDNPLVWTQRAGYAEWRKEREMAQDAYEKLVRLVPENPAYHNNYAYYLLQSGGDTNTALQEAKVAQERMPGNANVLHTLGLAQLRTGDVQQALETLRAAVERRPGDPTLLLDFGQALVKTDQPEEGKRHAQMALQCADLLQLDFPRRAEAEQLAPPAPRAEGASASAS